MPDDLAKAARLLLDSRFGNTFEEINLNCGCPALSAGAGAHGAFLLKQTSRSLLVDLIERFVRVIFYDMQGFIVVF